jgi:two-component system sensor histidine kinase UhpB
MELINKLSSSLVTPLLKDFGLYNVLQELVEEINKTKTLHVTLENEQDALERVDSKQMLMFYRIIQVQLDNIIKHSGAKNAVINFKTDDKLSYLSIQDDGQGFDTTVFNNGFGLRQIKNRVEFYGGNLQINSSPGKGCLIQISIPLQSQQNQYDYRPI